MSIQSKQSLGLRIRARREDLELTQTQLAKLVGKTSAAYISLIEAGERNISALDLMLLAKSLSTTTSELLGEERTSSSPVKQALRADKSLSEEKRANIEAFYDFIKTQQ